MSDREPHCPKCGRELTASTAQTAAVCHACDDHKYDIARSAGYYEHALRAVVLEMKERPVLSSRVASVLLGRFTSIEFINYPCLIPVPLSRKRLLERGFNQADIIARHLGRRTGLRVIRNSLIRTGHTAMHRGGMDRKAREMSVKDSFEVVGAKRIEGMRVVVIDDVFTSGATASECAASLKNAGASSVGVFTLARTRYL